MTELQILSAVKNNGGVIQYTELLSLNLSDEYQDPQADKARIVKMINEGLLSGTAEAYSCICITATGRMHLQNATYLEKQNKKLTKDASKHEAKKNRHDWYLAIVGALIAAIVGLVFEILSYLLFK